MKRSCVQCGKVFELDEGEIQFYKEKGFELPKRCRECREENKQKQKNDRRQPDEPRQGGKEKLSPRESVPANVTGNGPGSRNGSRLRPAFIVAVAVVVILLYASGLLFHDAGDGPDAPAVGNNTTVSESTVSCTFRNRSSLSEHFEKHGAEFGYETEEEYLLGANRVVSADGALHKTEAEDGDDIYYLEESNEIVFVSGDGFIRTYFKPDDGRAYYDRQ